MPAGKNRIILALETAVGAGSVALLKDNTVLAETDDSFPHPSRAEELLTVVRTLIETAGISLSDVDTIAVSTGPGSYSGIRIGASTAIGLKNALGIVCHGVSILEAMAFDGPSIQAITAAVPVGKNDVAWQTFDRSDSIPRALSQACLTPISEFTNSFGDLDANEIRAPRAFLEKIVIRDGRLHAADDAMTLAALIGRYVLTAPAGEDRLRPIYLRSGTGF